MYGLVVCVSRDPEGGEVVLEVLDDAGRELSKALAFELEIAVWNFCDSEELDDDAPFDPDE